QAQHVWTRSRTWDARLFRPPLYRLSYPDESSRRDSNPRPRGPELPAAPLLGENRVLHLLAPPADAGPPVETPTGVASSSGPPDGHPAAGGTILLLHTHTDGCQ